MKDSQFCCTGCEFVYGMIHDLHLERYYELKDKKLSPLIGLLRKRQDLDWVEGLVDNNNGYLAVKIHGIQCAACVWLIQEMAKKMGRANVSINTAYGVMKIRFDPKAFDLLGFLQRIQSLGYQPTPIGDENKGYQSRGLLIRLGICAALSMNIMMYSASLYTGLNHVKDPLLFYLVTHINVVLATLAMLVGGLYFLQRGFNALRSKVLHFDLPIALGILLAYTGSLYIHFFIDPEKAFFDTVTIFITLMLAGRFVQQRMIERNKNRILEKSTVSDFRIRRKSKSNEIQEVPYEQIKKGDELLIPLGSFFPVDVIAKEEVEIDVSWITGEPLPEKKNPGEVIPSGSTLLGPHSILTTSQEDYQHAALSELLSRVEEKETLPRMWQLISKYYVLGVLMLATLGFVFWYLTADLSTAISVAVSIAVVTCPCSLGLAIPLAKTLTYRHLMNQGVLIQEPHTLEDVEKVQNIAFDKTGTITLSDLYWQNFDTIKTIEPETVALIYNATSRSYHPASRAIYQKLHSLKYPLINLQITEEVGQGLYFVHDGDDYFIGRSQNQDEQEEGYLVSIQKNGKEVLEVILQEVLQDEMKDVVQSLCDSGKELYVVSGDQKKRVEKVANGIGISKENVFAGCSPKDKEQIVQRINQAPTMFIGDGLNDQLAMNHAQVSALSLHGHLQLAQNSNLYFISQSMKWIPALFRLSKGLKSAVVFNLRFLVVYNFLAVSLAMMGVITPLICAIIMPVSSLIVIALTVRKMEKLM